MRANYRASESKLFIFSDAPKDEKSSEGVAKVREYISTIDGFASVEIIKRRVNYGCAKNIICGISQVTDNFDRVIVVEDDILTSKYFLSYMNDALELYKDDERVGEVTGFLIPAYVIPGEQLPQSFFMNRTSIWGWGTWQRSWCCYEYDAWKLLERIKAAGLEDKYNYGIKSKPRSANLKAQALGYIGTWDYQFSASFFLHNYLTLSPGQTFTNNIGCDGTGEHCGVTDYDKMNLKLADSYTPLQKIPVEVNEHITSIYLASLLKKEHSLPYRILRRIWHILKHRRPKRKL